LANQLPIQQQERTIVVDVLRGFALFGVLLGNFSSMLTNLVPPAIIDAHETGMDRLLSELHDIFIENKFMTLFSILFGYGFGVIMQRLERNKINSIPFFLRRMFWLFILGCLNLALWNGDILHIYAMTGIFLLFFRKQRDRSVLLFSVFFLFVLPAAIRVYQHYVVKFPSFVQLVNNNYQIYKYGSLKDVAVINYKVYPSQWIFTWIEWRDISETLGRFLLGYYILRKQLLTKLDENILFIKKVWKYAAIFAILYITLRELIDEKIISIEGFIIYPFLKFGILSTTLFYATSLTRLYYYRKLRWLMQIFRNLGCMTLTNYLAETLIYIIIFYHAGFGLLGDFSFGIIWLSTFIVYFLQAVFSKWWLSKFYYGPVEWIWRQLSYMRRFKLIKEKTTVTIA
jgi:uncharacterized protein